jgi:hypothetical protein
MDVKLKNFVDFALSLVRMDEVEKNEFPLPNKITYILDDIDHKELQREVHREKGFNTDDIIYTNEFEVDIFTITFTFIKSSATGSI